MKMTTCNKNVQDEWRSRLLRLRFDATLRFLGKQTLNTWAS